MRRPFRIAACLLVSSLVTAPLPALTIFDILQLTEEGYDSKEIVALIEATDSMFELEAEDLPKLKELGVDEAVIREMLQRVPAERPEGLPRESPKPPLETAEKSAQDATAHSDDGSEHGHEDPDRDDAHDRNEDPAETGSVGPAAPPLVSYSGVNEERSGDHHHSAISISGIEVIVLRDESAFSSIEARAREVVRRLDDAWALGGGMFYSDSRDAGPVVAYQSAATHQRITVLEITAADARAYEIRSGQEVSRELLAAYWADLLTDFSAITMGKAPHRMTSLHAGEALGVLHRALKSSQGRGGLQEAAELLPRSTRHHLESLATRVPSDYEM